jgi:hypothetical protein
MFDPTKIKWNEPVWCDQPYIHPQLGITVPRDFYDRTDEKKRLELFIQDNTQKLAIILGERRSGKTSMLKLQLERFKIAWGQPFIIVFFPWQSVRSRHELIKEILQTTASELEAELPLMNRSGDGQLLSMTNSEFLHTMRRLLGPRPDKKVVVCIDELDSMIYEAPRNEGGAILGLVNALVENTDLPIKLLLTMVRFPDLPETYVSPLFARSLRVDLSPFSKADLDEMVQDHLPDDSKYLFEQDLDRLYEFSGGWPHFAKMLLVYTPDLRPGNLGLDDAVAQAIDDPGVELTIRHIYNEHFDDQEKQVVLLLSKRHERLAAETVSLLDASLHAALARLEKRCFVAKDQAMNYRFRIGFLAHWFPRWVQFEEEVEYRLQDVLRSLELPLR